MMVRTLAANQEAFDRINAADPVLRRVRYRHEVLPELDRFVLLHAGPSLSWSDMCGPLKGAILGALRFEGLAETDAEAEALISTGKVQFIPNHAMNAVGPMTGITSYSMPLMEVENVAFGNVAYCTINEGMGKVMRFGANDDEVLDRLRWIRDELGPTLDMVLSHTHGMRLKVILSKALAMGDEFHQRNIAASALFCREFFPLLSREIRDLSVIQRVSTFIAENEQWFLNLAMAAGKATMDPVRNIEGSTVVTAMARNGTNFGIQVSSLGDQWFEAPVNEPKGLYFPGFSKADANPDIGDSTIVETFGLGGMVMGAAPAVTRFVGADSVDAAYAYTRNMGEITVGASPHYLLPNMNFIGAPTGIDIIKVVETGLLPVINTGIAHRSPGVGQVGAGIVSPPMKCFEDALRAFALHYGI